MPGSKGTLHVSLCVDLLKKSITSIMQLDMKAVPLNDSDNCIFNSQPSAVIMWKSYELIGWK